MAKYVLQHLGYPTTGIIREDQWSTYSTHDTESAAFKQMEKATAHLQPGQWDDHYRVIGPDGQRCSYEQFKTQRMYDKLDREWRKRK